ncbi:MAG TPA: YihY/virulence factor BrkB family protein [Bacteroidales bacterium]|nr:YihY/virulence factor BrkB family protein [Bacteroidales bacterium]
MKKRIQHLVLRRLSKPIQWLKMRSFPGFYGYPIYDVGAFFLKGLLRGHLGIRAAGVAFNVFLSLFPLIIFFFTLIPYIPVENFQIELLEFIKDVLPDEAYSLFSVTIEDTIVEQRGQLLSLGIVMMLFFSSNGILALIHAFNATYHSLETRSGINRRLISVLLVIILSVLFTTAISLVTASDFLMDALLSIDFMKSSWVFFIMNVLKWLIVVALFFFSTSFLYFLAPSKKDRFRFISPGATLATIIQIVAILLFTVYLNNFAQYNKLYGSIGTIMIVMLLLYITAYALLLGFELNASINENKILKHNSRQKK